MDGYISIAVSTLALVLAVLTAWLTLFRKGKIRMTQPSIVVFAQDSEEQTPKIYLRGLLYCSAIRGRVVENMYANLRKGNTTTTFAFWAYGARNDLVRGGGLFVGPEGISVNHHFVLLSRGASYEYRDGKYIIEIFATTVGQRTPHKLSELTITLNEESAKVLTDKSGSVMFNLNPNTNNYHPETKMH